MAKHAKEIDPHFITVGELKKHLENFNDNDPILVAVDSKDDDSLSISYPAVTLAWFEEIFKGGEHTDNPFQKCPIIYLDQDKKAEEYDLWELDSAQD